MGEWHHNRGFFVKERNTSWLVAEAGTSLSVNHIHFHHVVGTFPTIPCIYLTLIVSSWHIINWAKILPIASTLSLTGF